jgi:hypothetical protein
MATVDEKIVAAIKSLGPKPADSASRAEKKRFSEKLSNAVAQALADELRERGMDGARPAGPGVLGKSGAERRMSGGIGAKKVDVTWATEESGLLLGISIKSISFRDKSTKNFQKNLTNRRGDMLFEAVTLHRKFPYAVLAGFFILDKEAAADHTGRRQSTFQNSHTRFRLFTGRSDPAGREEQYERLFIVLLDADQFTPAFVVYPVGETEQPISLEQSLDELVNLIAERDSDFYEVIDGKLKRLKS